MTLSRRSLILGLVAGVSLSACGRVASAERTNDRGLHKGETPAIRAKINHWADHYHVPRSLVHRIVQRESGYNPRSQHRSYYGLMQIDPRTARTMGFKGAPADLLDPDTNLKYGVKYLRGAWLCADGSESRAISWYAKGYYYEAKRRGILKEAGLKG